MQQKPLPPIGNNDILVILHLFIKQIATIKLAFKKDQKRKKKLTI